jgi:ectoine hydroxylase-related dioxygenase (phytanoyl-CoA dioxygenase family)
MLTETQVKKYNDDGYVIPDYRLPADVLEQIRADHDRLLRKHPQFRDYCPQLLAWELSFLNYARDPNILDMVEQLIGENFALWNSSFFAKPALDGNKTPWHQDGEYWPIRPVATCTVWIAIDDATRDNGCLKFMPGSHKRRELRKHHMNEAAGLTLNQELGAEEYDEDRAFHLELEAGQMSLHDVFLVHGSEANASPHSRRGMTLRYMPTTSLFDRALADQQTEEMKLIYSHSGRTLYLMRGIDACGQNDYRMRL